MAKFFRFNQRTRNEYNFVLVSSFTLSKFLVFRSEAKGTPIPEEMGVGASASKLASWRADEEGMCGYLCDSSVSVCRVPDLDG